MKNRTLKNVLCVIGGLVFVAAMIFIFAVVINVLSTETKVESYNGKLEMTIPSGWVTTEKGELNDVADFEVRHSTEEVYFIAIMSNKDDYEVTYDEFRENAFAQIEEIYGITIEEIETLKNENGKDYEFVAYDTIYEQTKLAMRSYVIETDKYYGQILAWSVASAREELNEVADDMVLSIVEK